MKKALAILTVLLFSSFAFGQKKSSPATSVDSTDKVQIAEAACGECKFLLAGKGCHLAVRIKGNAYFVDGSNIDDHGDAHAKDGFCMAIRKAKIKGHVVNGRFVANYFKLIPEKK